MGKLTKAMLEREFKTVKEQVDQVVAGSGVRIQSPFSIELKVNYRTKSRLGQCTNRGFDAHDSIIEISNYIYQNDNMDIVRETLAHEYLHAITPRSGHKGNWKQLAKIVSSKTPYEIKRTTDIESLGLATENRYNYVFKCTSCGQEYKYMRKSKYVKMLLAGGKGLSCGKCGHTEIKKV